MAIKTHYGTWVEILREIKPWQSNGKEFRQVEVWGRNQVQPMLLRYLKEDKEGEIERAIKKG